MPLLSSAQDRVRISHGPVEQMRELDASKLQVTYWSHIIDGLGFPEWDDQDVH